MPVCVSTTTQDICGSGTLFAPISGVEHAARDPTGVDSVTAYPVSAVHGFDRMILAVGSIRACFVLAGEYGGRIPVRTIGEVGNSITINIESPE